MAFFAVVPAAAAGLNLSPAQAGMVVSIFVSGYVTALWLSGFLSLRRKTVIAAGIILSLFSNMAIWLFPARPVILVAGPLGAFGVGLYLPRGLSLLAEATPPDRRGRVISYHEGAAMFGMVVGPLYAGRALTLVPWPAVLAVWSIVGLASLAMLLLVPEGVRRDPGEVVPAPRFAWNRQLMCLTLAASAVFTLLMGLTSVFPLLMVAAWGVDPSYAASYTGTTRLAGLAGIMVSGRLVDRYGHAPTFQALMVLAFVSLVVMAAVGFGFVFTSAFLVLGASISGSTLILYVVITQGYPGKDKDRAVGVISGTGSAVATVLAPAAFGYLIERFPPGVTFATAAACALIGLAVSPSFRPGMPPPHNVSHAR